MAKQGEKTSIQRRSLIKDYTNKSNTIVTQESLVILTLYIFKLLLSCQCFIIPLMNLVLIIPPLQRIDKAVSCTFPMELNICIL